MRYIIIIILHQNINNLFYGSHIFIVFYVTNMSYFPGGVIHDIAITIILILIIILIK